MIRREQHGMVWLEFSLLQEFASRVQHAVFLRRNAQEEMLPIKPMQHIFGNHLLVCADLEHGIRIEHVTDELKAKYSCDALLTTHVKRPLAITHADCQATILYDPCRHLLMNIHCGWRGNRHHIYHEAVKEAERRGSRPQDLLACIGPSLGPRRAEFVNYEEEWPCDKWAFRVNATHFDLWEMSRMQLQEAGLLASHIEIAKLCTYENPESFFSFRRAKHEGKTTGRHVTMAMLL